MTKANAKANDKNDDFVDQLLGFALALQRNGWSNRDILELLQHAQREAQASPAANLSEGSFY